MLFNVILKQIAYVKFAFLHVAQRRFTLPLLSCLAAGKSAADWIFHAPLSLVRLSLNCCVTSLPIGTNNVGVSLDLGFAGVALGLVPFSKKQMERC